MDHLSEEELATTLIYMAPILRLEGQQFGEYRLLRRLGRGGYAEVYLGENVHIGMRCAIKVFPIEDDSGDFVGEARHIAQLRHPHIVQIYQIGRASCRERV